MRPSLGSRRRSLRRAIGLECSVACDLWDGSLPLFATDVSHEGLWVDTPYPLEEGDEVVVSFAPPGAAPSEDVWAIAEVARVGGLEPQAAVLAPGMGLSFTYLNAVDRRFLIDSLVGHPPRLPGRRRPPPLPWHRTTTPPRRPAPPARLFAGDVTFLDTDDGVPALSELLPFEHSVRPLGELLTAARPVYRFHLSG
jgi:hypothetical protein